MGEVDKKSFDRASVDEEVDSEGSKLGEGAFGVAPIFDGGNIIVMEALFSARYGGSGSGL